MKLLTVKQVAELLQVTEQTVYNLMSRKELKKVKVGRASRIEEKNLMEYIERNTNIEARDRPQRATEAAEGVEYISTKEAARRLKKATRTIQRYVNQGKLEGYKDGHEWKISKESIKKYQEEEDNE